MRLNPCFLCCPPTTNPQIQVKMRLAKARKMPKQHKFPTAGRRTTLPCHHPKHFWLFLPAFHTVPGRLPRPYAPCWEMAHGPKLISRRPHSLTNRGCSQREAPSAPLGPFPRIPGIRGVSVGSRLRSRGARGARARFKGPRGLALPRHLRRRPPRPLRSAPARERAGRRGGGRDLGPGGAAGGAKVPISAPPARISEIPARPLAVPASLPRGRTERPPWRGSRGPTLCGDTGPVRS